MSKTAERSYYRVLLCYLLMIVSCWHLAMMPALASDKDKGNVKADSTISAPIYQLPGDSVIVRHSPIIDSARVEGSIRVLTGENINISSGAVITGNLYVPGAPNIHFKGHKGIYNGTREGNSSTATGYTININSNVKLKSVVTKTDPIIISNLPVVPEPTGTKDLNLNKGVSLDDSSNIRDLVVNANYGTLNLLAGTYGRLTVNSNNTLVLGIDGQNTVYNLQGLILGSNVQVKVLGSVTINVNNGFNLSSNTTIGSHNSPASLLMNISNGDLNINKNVRFYGSIIAPRGLVTVSGGSVVRGIIVCDRINLNSNATIEALTPDTTAPVITIEQPAADSIIRQSTVTVTGSVMDDSTVSVKVNNIDATINGNSYTVDVPLSDFGGIDLTAVATDEFGNSASTTTHIQRADESNQVPIVSAGSAQTINLSNNAVLSGSISDDGLPNPPQQVTASWTVVSMPTGGAVTFASSSSATTTASFNVVGIYVLKLTANDGQLSASSTVSVIVNDNHAPAVDAGPAQTITLPATASLRGTATDDGQPNPPGQVTISWSKISGPGTVTFSNPHILTPTATFSEAGNYVLRLTVDDSELSASKDVNIIVNPEPQNRAPVVNAGQNQTVIFPTTVALQGSYTDDGLPLAASISANWSVMSAPAGAEVTFSNANALTPMANFSAPGTYVLKLSVSDSQLSGNDMVTIVQKLRSTLALSADILGFVEETMTVKAGDYLIALENRLGRDGVTYVLTQGSQTQSVTVARAQEGFIQAKLVPGTATITVTDEPDLVVTLTITE